MKLDKYNIKIRCPRLGHEVSFDYCRKEDSGLPCNRALICWGNVFDVESILKQELSSDDWKKIFETPPKPKLVSLLELIKQAKKHKKDT